ncbi:Hypothetical predicted protein [Xyrichtys novacula]|uniref:Uncharacterized protein n=1 Tax=Xyrichtys novacula TaxID=13765 RepID=A0AAV1H7C5_XYRNO|nr:Hypothetical predicted protein [Xyrichtys novacula]
METQKHEEEEEEEEKSHVGSERLRLQQEQEAPAQSHETARQGPRRRLMGAVTGPGPCPYCHTA